MQIVLAMFGTRPEATNMVFPGNAMCTSGSFEIFFCSHFVGNSRGHCGVCSSGIHMRHRQ